MAEPVERKVKTSAVAAAVASFVVAWVVVQAPFMADSAELLQAAIVVLGVLPPPSAAQDSAADGALQDARFPGSLMGFGGAGGPLDDRAEQSAHTGSSLGLVVGAARAVCPASTAGPGRTCADGRGRPPARWWPRPGVTLPGSPGRGDHGEPSAGSHSTRPCSRARAVTTVQRTW